MVFWDMIAGVYDLFEKIYNGRCYDGTGARVAQEINKNDIVLDSEMGQKIGFKKISFKNLGYYGLLIIYEK